MSRDNQRADISEAQDLLVRALALLDGLGPSVAAAQLDHVIHLLQAVSAKRDGS